MQINGKELFVLYSGQTDQQKFDTTPQPLDPNRPTLVFIHGLGSSHNFYYAVACSLLKHANCILIDTEGAGLSTLQNTTISIDSVSNDVVSVLQKLDVAQAILVGHSMGGMIALSLAEKFPKVIKGVIAIGPIHPSDKLRAGIQSRHDAVQRSNSTANAATMISNAALGSNATSVHRGMVRALVCSQNPIGYMANCQLIIQAEAPDYSKIRAPVAFIYGTDDTTAPYEGGIDHIAQSLSQKPALYPLEGVGHWHCVEASDRVGGAISQLLAIWN